MARHIGSALLLGSALTASQIPLDQSAARGPLDEAWTDVTCDLRYTGSTIQSCDAAIKQYKDELESAKSLYSGKSGAISISRFNEMRAYAEKRLSDAYAVRQILLRRAKLNPINSKSPSKYLWPGSNIIAEDFVSKNFTTSTFAGMDAVGRPAASNPFSYIYQASGSFVVSNVTLPNGATQCPKSHPTYRASQWIGIGGMNPRNYGWVTDQDLYQAGVVYDIDCKSFPYNPIITVVAFWQDASYNGGFGGNIEQDLAYPVNPGDTIDVTARRSAFSRSTSALV